MCAVAYNDLAKRLDTQAQKTADATEKADLTKRANAARSRSLDFWLDLLGIAPHQTLATYRYVLFQLDKRESEPKSADYRKIAEIAPKVLSLFKDDEAALDELAQIRILLGSAQARLGQWRDAIPPLEAVDAAYEPSFDARMKKYEADKKRYDENPDKYPAPRRPVRHPLQVQARELLARSYLETKARSKLKEALQIYVDQVNTFPSRQSPKHWEGMYYLIETNRLAGDYQSATGYLYRAVAVIDENVLKTGVGTRKDFVDLAARLAKDVEASADAAAKKSLMPTIQDILKKLGK